MLEKFEVENFRGFEKPLSFSLVAGRYDFNPQVESQGLVKNAIVYGPNGIGKSTLGVALFDIILHLTDKNRMGADGMIPFLNMNHLDRPARFRYEFRFGPDRVVYEYTKTGPDELRRERLLRNGERLIDFDYFRTEKRARFVSKSLIGDLNIDLVDNKLSVVKYIYRNLPTNFAPVVTDLVQFCESMLWYRSLSDGNRYAGFTNGINLLDEILYTSGKREEFRRFLAENGIPYDLEFRSVEGRHVLHVRFKGGSVPFDLVASTGTRALYLFFAWSISAFPKVSFLFIDEFDAFLHYESAAAIVRTLNRSKTFQTILTTHNTSLMNNALTRPDCCYVMSYEDGAAGGPGTPIRIKSLAEATPREVRQVHNLEKMYRNGVFHG